MRYIAVIITSLVAAFAVPPVLAQEISLPPECRLLAEHKPDADVHYKPGADIVNGRPVASADLSPPSSIGRDTIVVPLNIDLAERLQGMSVQGLELVGNLGYLEIWPDGRVLHNGQDLTPQIYALCGEKVMPPVKRDILTGKPVPAASAPDGQPQTDRIK